jgi:hypothetical protein
MSRNLPPFPNLAHLKKQAKKHLRELQRHNRTAKLTQAQDSVAREYGFAAWSGLKAHVSAPPPPTRAALLALDGPASDRGLYLHAPQTEEGRDGVRYTECARHALFFSRLEADRHGSPLIEPEHVLLGLIHRYNPSAIPVRLFERSHLSLETVRNEIDGRLQEGASTPDGMPVRSSADRALQTPPRTRAISGAALTNEFKKKLPQREVPFSLDTKRMLHQVAAEAERLRHADRGSPHLLLGLLSMKESVAASVLRKNGMRLDKVRNDFVHLLTEERK